MQFSGTCAYAASVKGFCVSTLALGYQSPGGLQCPQVLYLKTDFDTPESNRITAYQSSSNRLCYWNVEVTKNVQIDLHIQQLMCLKVLISHNIRVSNASWSFSKWNAELSFKTTTLNSTEGDSSFNEHKPMQWSKYSKPTKLSLLIYKQHFTANISMSFFLISA